MIDNQKVYLSVTCGTVNGYHDMLVLPNILFRFKTFNNSSGIGLGWWKWRAYINLSLTRKPKTPVNHYAEKF